MTKKLIDYAVVFAQFTIICFILQICWNQVFKYFEQMQIDILQSMSVVIILIIVKMFLHEDIKTKK